MKEVVRYMSDDKILFDSRGKCLLHEARVKKVKEILSLLKPYRGTGTEFVQQDVGIVEKVKNLLLDEMLIAFPEWQDKIDEARNYPVPYSIIGRYLSDSSSAFYKGWWILLCIDDKGRQWSQPYYTNNYPVDAKEI